MPNERNFSYKGCSITTRWIEIANDSHRAGKQFIASYSVSPPDPGEESWQQFPKAVFDSAESANVNALSAARASVDLSLDEGRIVTDWAWL